MTTIMRYSPAHKDEVRARIIGQAATLLRGAGLDGVGIPALMKQAGLTHGAFYAHFPSRDALVAEAVAAAAAQTGDEVVNPALGLTAICEQYLSMAHVAHPERGCVLAALGPEAPRQAPPVREAFARAARGMLARVQAALGPPGPPSDAALRAASAMVGAGARARLVGGPALAQRILDAARPASPA